MALSVADPQVKVEVYSNSCPRYVEPRKDLSVYASTDPSAFVAFLAMDDNLTRLRLSHDITFDILKMFRPFFVMLNLPFSVVRLENLTAEAVIFNYKSRFTLKTVLIDLRNATTFDTVLSLPVDPPGKVVGSDKVTINVVGDILGVAMRNLDKLIQLPLGCGENNLALMAPSVTVWKYLQKVGKLSTLKREELTKNIRMGHQRALIYQHPDSSFGAWARTQPNGSFYAWSASDENGSTWLTAHLARVFAEASALVPDVDETVMHKMVADLIGQQRDDGSFEETAQILDKRVQDGEFKDVSLTGLCVLAFLQYNSTGKANLDNLDEAMRKAVTYLESQLDKLGNDSFALVLAAYALAKANSPRKLDALALLSEHMVAETSTINWTTGSSGDLDAGTTEAKDVEASSYALLAFIANGKLNTAAKIAAWLVSQQNAQGGFTTTADTVVALQALAEFAYGGVEIDTLSGYQFDAREVYELPKTVEQLRKAELKNKDSKLNWYFDEITMPGKCFRLTMYRIHKVDNLQNQAVGVYDYYNPKD
ncbi:CD109 antigen-like [Paramacrobiotus metropolitanus]|uniref:CD109 antigen-like n=1 Tax=Paramacrobiotus metropolitanus TaxID=2943436 RepID=UPI0024463DB7|nr:CD109 antigen-like [Paramacrobiotus metropolitanus]